jgi:hypothetical protein
MNEEKDFDELTDEEQVELIEETDNGLTPEDAANIPQPPQDPDWRPDDVVEDDSEEEPDDGVQ